MSDRYFIVGGVLGYGEGNSILPHASIARGPFRYEHDAQLEAKELREAYAVPCPFWKFWVVKDVEDDY